MTLVDLVCLTAACEKEGLSKLLPVITTFAFTAAVRHGLGIFFQEITQTKRNLPRST